jgi:hypothetical protein
LLSTESQSTGPDRRAPRPDDGLRAIPPRASPARSVPEQIDHEMTPAASPLEALLTVHRDGLGSKRVRLQDGPFVFSNPADRSSTPGSGR